MTIFEYIADILKRRILRNEVKVENNINGDKISAPQRQKPKLRFFGMVNIILAIAMTYYSI